MRQATTVARLWRGAEGKFNGLVLHGAKGLVALAILVTLLSCSSGASTRKQPAPQISALPNALPAFSDWRAAYVGTDNRLHAITLNGKTDVSGPALPGMDSTELNFASAGVSPNGHLLAYDANAGLSILDVTEHGSSQSDPIVGAIYQMFWSPDGSELALCDGEGSLWLAKPSMSGRPNQDLQTVPGTPGQGIGILLGWVDGADVVVTMNPTPTSITLGELDVTSGRLRPVATISAPDLSTYGFSLSPDGTEALFYNERYRDQPYTPLVDLITIATSAVTPLPHLAQIMGPYSGFTSVAWQRGTNVVAVSTGFKENGDLKAWLLDVRNDSSSPLANGFYPMAWAPSGNTLVVGTGAQLTMGTGPFELDAITMAPDGHTTSIVLTRYAISFPFVGFVRTA